MRNNLFAKRAFTVGIIAALFAAFLIGPAPVAADGTGTIVFDYTHGQYSSNLWNTTDLIVADALEAMGYTVVFAYGGINASVLDGAVGFVAGSIYGSSNGYTAAEFTTIADWFNAGNKFMWIGYDSDYAGRTYINDNMTKILEDTGSHVFGEPLSVEDPISSAASGYRAIANGTSDNSFVAPIVAGVEKVLMHGPTCLYGSSSATEGTDVVALETGSIANVYPLLYFGGSATIVNADLVNGYAHDEGDTGAFVAATLEIGAGTAGNGVIIVSGASPYGDYRPMAEAEYYDIVMTGGLDFVVNGIDFGMNQAQAMDMTLILAIGAIGAVVVIVIIIAVMKRN
ncbi:MAG: hypothetical protein ACW98Y_04120 [Candidatus Thorarchaeota archaeon]|jgi:hypothetical protein